MQLIKTLTLTLPKGDELTLMPPARSVKTFRPWLVELQALWIAHGFDVYATVTDDRAWDLMQQIINCLPRQDSPQNCGIDLTLLSNDYSQLRWLFLQSNDLNLRGWFDGEGSLLTTEGAMATFVEAFEPGKLLEICEINGAALLMEAQQRSGELIASKSKPTAIGRKKQQVA